MNFDEFERQFWETSVRTRSAVNKSVEMASAKAIQEELLKAKETSENLEKKYPMWKQEIDKKKQELVEELNNLSTDESNNEQEEELVRKINLHDKAIEDADYKLNIAKKNVETLNSSLQEIQEIEFEFGEEIEEIKPIMFAKRDDETNLIINGLAKLLKNNTSETSENFHYNILPDLSKNIEDFDATGSSSDAKNWLRSIESMGTLHRWTPAILLETARSHLKNGARNWYLSLVEDIHDWKQFCVAFRASFIQEKSLTERWKEMTRRQQKESETSVDYYFDKVRLCKMLNLNAKETKTQVAIGLSSKDISMTIMAKDHATLDELLWDIRNLEEFQKERREKFSRQRNFNSSFALKKNNEKDEPQVAHQNTGRTELGKNKQKDFPSNKCHRCGQLGHYVKECPGARTLRCYKCNEIGHVSKNCTQSEKTLKNEVNVVNTIGTVNNKDKYMKNILIGNVMISAFIDQGSSDCTITASTAIREGFKIERCISDLRGFGTNENIIRSYGVIRECVQVDDAKADNIQFRVVPDEAQNYEVIIGRNFTELAHIVYVKMGESLKFSNSDLISNEFFLDMRMTDELKVKNNCSNNPGTIKCIEMLAIEKIIKVPYVNISDKVVNFQKGDRVEKLRYTEEKVMSNYVKPRSEILENEINTDPKITKEQKNELVVILNKYRECFASNIFELGCTNEIEMKIQLKPGVVPKSSKPYKKSLKEREIMKEIVNEWKTAGIVRETNSPYLSPCILTYKKDGSPRLIVDYRFINSYTIPMPFPIPSMDEYLEILHGSCMFAVLDLSHGYLQMPLSEDSKQYTGFITPDDTGEFNCAMFGLMNAPYYFAKLMKKVLHPLRNDVVVNFFDDTLLRATSWKNLLDLLIQVLELFKKARLTLNLKKCFFLGCQK